MARSKYLIVHGGCGPLWVDRTDGTIVRRSHQDERSAYPWIYRFDMQERDRYLAGMPPRLRRQVADSDSIEEIGYWGVRESDYEDGKEPVLYYEAPYWHERFRFCMLYEKPWECDIYDVSLSPEQVMEAAKRWRNRYSDPLAVDGPLWCVRDGNDELTAAIKALWS